MKAFIDFVESVLPSVSPDFRDGAKNAIEQFKKDGKEINLLSNKPLKEISQGDIFSDMVFSYYDKDGNVNQYKAKAMVISTSCNIDNKPRLTFVPILPIGSFKGKIEELRNNTIFDYMHISNGEMDKYYVDFSHFCTYDKSFFMSVLERGIVKRLYSLNQIGYYYFIIKLTVYLMRKEDSGTLVERASIQG